MAVTAEEAARQLLEIAPLVMRTVRAQMREHRAPGLSVPQFRTLAFLNQHSGVSLSRVAEHIGVTLASMSKMVDALVTQGWVTRETDATDRRRVTLTLTAPGHVLVTEARLSTQAYLAGMFAALPGFQCETIVEAMHILRPIFTTDRSPVSPGDR